MFSLLVVFHLAKPDENKESILKIIEGFKPFIKISDSAYMIMSPKNASSTFYNSFKGQLTQGKDNLYIIPISNEIAGTHRGITDSDEKTEETISPENVHHDDPLNYV